MKINDVSLSIPLQRLIPIWESKRIERLKLERIYQNYSGYIDIVELHCNHTFYDYVADLVNRTRKKKGRKMLVLAGDNIDLSMLSQYHSTTQQSITPTEEKMTLIKLLKYILPYYDDKMIMLTNHDNRIVKVIGKYVYDKQVADEIKANQETLKQTFIKNDVNITFCDNSLFQIGDCLIVHPENNSSIPAGLARWCSLYYPPRIEKPFNVCFIAHSHCQSKIPLDRRLYIEISSISQTQDYWRKGKLLGKGKLSTLGSAHAYLEKGKCDLNQCDFYINQWEDYL